MTSVRIARILYEKDIINSEILFILYSKIIAKDTKLRAGEYIFSPKISVREVVDIISNGESILRRITIPEGLNTYEIVQLLNSEKRLVGEIYNIPEEGTLLPDTYYFKYGDLRSNIIKEMKRNMIEALNELMDAYELPNNIKNLDQVVTLASIIEKEAGNHAEKPIISSVFQNRLRIGMKLQADPTVIYSITRGIGSLGRMLRKSDLKFDSPYNTYKYYGLPPGPISCPGYLSLEAVFKPSDTNYLYFVVDGKGGHNFSTNLKDHINNIRKFKSLKSGKN